MFAKVPRTSGAQEPPDTTPPRRGTVAIVRMERDERRYVRRQVGALLFSPLLGILLALLYTFTRPVLYEATGTVRLVPSSLQAPPPPGLPPGFTYYGTNAIRPHERADELQILTSNSFLRGLAPQLPRELKQRLLGDDPQHYEPDQLSNDLVGELAAGLTIAGNQQNELLQISFDHPDPAVAADVVNEVVAAAGQVGLHLGEQRNRRAAAFFAGQIGALKQRLRAAQDRENAVERGTDAGRREARRLAGSDYLFEAGGDDPELAPLERASTQAHLAQRLAEGEVRLLESLQKDDEPGLESSRELETLSADLHIAEAEYAMLGATLGPNQPQMLARAAAIAKYQQQLSTATAGRLRAARSIAAQTTRNAHALDVETKLHQDALRLSQKDRVRDAMLEIDLALDLNVYEAIRAKLQSAKINAGLGATDLQVIDEAYVPDKPMPRKFAVPVTVGLVAGALLGIFPSVYFGELRQRRWTIDTLERRLELPALAILSEQPAGALGFKTELPHDFEDGLRNLARELLLLPRAMHRGVGPQVILFTSAAPSEGKTSTVCSFARVRAREGKRVLLIDADLHRPSIHKFFGLSGRLGVSSVLNGRATLAEALQPVAGSPSLQVLVAGPVAPSPSDLLSSERLKEMLAQAAGEYDLILIDSPPVLALMDSVTLAPIVDVVLLVTRYDKLTLAQAAHARRLLDRAHAPLGGIVVNGAPAE